MNKRRRISGDGESSEIQQPTTATPGKLALLPSFMTPTKASLAKSYPHLVPKSQPRQAQRVVSPARRTLRRSIAPEGGVNDALGVDEPTDIGVRSFMEIANDDDRDSAMLTLTVREPTTAATTQSMTSHLAMGKEKHLASEEEIEQRKSFLMRRLRLLRAECENLEQQLEQGRQSKQAALSLQKEAQSDADATMYGTPIFIWELTIVNYFCGQTMHLYLGNPSLNQ
jgi:hypothetical protein